MFTVQGMRKFVCDRLTEAAQEILGAFEKRAQEYESELARQRRLLESVYSPDTTTLSDATGPHIKEEQNDICITDIQQPITSTNPQDVHGESQNLKSKEVQNAARKEQEGASTSHQVTEVSSHPQLTTKKTIPGKKRKTPAKRDYNKCSHGYRLPKGYVSKQINASKNNDLPVPLSNDPITMEVIEIEDNSPASSDIEIIRGEDEMMQGDDEMIQGDDGMIQGDDEMIQGDDEIIQSDNGQATIQTNNVKAPVCENATDDHINGDTLLKGKDVESAKDITSQMIVPCSVVTESNNVDDTKMLTYTNLDNVEKVSHISTEQATIHKDASENTASTSLTGSSTRKIDTDAAPNVINDKQPTCTKRSEIESSSVNQETTQKYSYEWKRPTQTKETCQKSPFECDICGKVSSNFKNYKSHVKSHTAEKKFKCTTCDKMFRESCDLTKHEKIHTGEKPFKCSDCGKAFNRRFNLDLHKRVHTGEKPYACGCCKKTFTSRVNLRKHERIHTGEKPYTCDQCKKEFADSSSFRNHQRVHTGEKPYKCCFCKKEFATRTTLKRHIRVHTGEKPYKCSRCEKSFATNTDMKVHMRIHTGERPYKCENCGQEFSSWTNYKRHTNIHKPKASEPMNQ